jgi:hypothetical protein
MENSNNVEILKTLQQLIITDNSKRVLCKLNLFNSVNSCKFLKRDK